jgi:hypothetical protein
MVTPGGSPPGTPASMRSMNSELSASFCDAVTRTMAC